MRNNDSEQHSVRFLHSSEMWEPPFMSPLLNGP